MKLYCRNTSTCRWLMLMSSFGISSDIKQPSMPHKCRDICSRTCNCFECTSVLLSFESCTPDDLICDNDLPISTEQSREDIVAYRLSSCMDLSCPTAALMVGVEICLGINNSMINWIVSNCTQITYLSDLTDLGVPVHHAHNILPIILSRVEKDT